MKTIGTFALATISCLVLGGCSTLHLPSLSKPAVANNDIPPAGELDVPRTQTLFLTIVGGLRDQGHSSAALAYLDEYDRQYPNDPRAQLLRARCLMDAGKSDEAEPVFARLLKSDDAAAAQAGLGKVAAGRSDWANAAIHFREAERLAPSTPEYANDLGYAQIQLGDYRGGIEMLGRATQLSPDDRFIRNNLILGLHLSGQDEQARRLVDTVADPADREKARRMLTIQASIPAAPAKAADATANSKEKGV